MTSAIFYHPEAYSVSGAQLMGRNAAGASFLKGFIEYSSLDQFYVQVQTLEQAQSFVDLRDQLGRTEAVKAFLMQICEPLAEPGNLFFPGPNIKEMAIRRTLFGDHLWSLTGITHTTSSAVAMDAIADLLVSPVQAHDALICTSHAVKNNVMSILEHHMDWMRERFAASKFVLPNLPVIPLGIDTRIFQSYRSMRASARQALAIQEDEVVVLYVGRLSFHAKAHPYAMYRALEKAVRSSSKKVVLLECGWFGNQHIATAFDEAFAEALGASVSSIRRIVLDGRNPSNQELSWASADIFCSLSDNIQETFGITPIEAMACGLPVVVSDWDGYKDTVRQGVDGFRVDTLMPAEDFVGDLARRHALEMDSYDRYCGYSSALIAVDVDMAAHALANLIQSESLRAKLGEQGRLRAQTVYDWRVIIPQYESLWRESAAMRRSVQQESKSKLAWAPRLDPFQAFAAYPTLRLDDHTVLSLNGVDSRTAMEKATLLRQLGVFNFAEGVIPDSSLLQSVFQALSQGPKSVKELLEPVDFPHRNTLKRGLTWLIKTNLVRNCI